MAYNDSAIQVYSVQKGYNISITHFPTNTTISFPAFLTNFKDSVQAEFDTSLTPGHINPVSNYKRTTRNVSFSIEVVSDSEVEASNNFYKIKKVGLFHFPYRKDVQPSNPFAAAAGITAIDYSRPNYLRIKFANLIRAGKSKGLIGIPSSFVISPKIEHGFFESGGSIYPKTYELSMSLDVIHEEDFLASIGGGSGGGSSTSTGGGGSASTGGGTTQPPTPPPPRRVSRGAAMLGGVGPNTTNPFGSSSNSGSPP